MKNKEKAIELLNDIINTMNKLDELWNESMVSGDMEMCETLDKHFSFNTLSFRVDKKDNVYNSKHKEVTFVILTKNDL